MICAIKVEKAQYKKIIFSILIAHILASPTEEIIENKEKNATFPSMPDFSNSFVSHFQELILSFSRGVNIKRILRLIIGRERLTIGK